MAISNTVKRISQGMGSATSYEVRNDVATAIGTVTITLPTTGSFSPSGVRSGMVRIKSESIVSGGTVQLGVCTATDGTTTVNIQAQEVALAANVLMERTFPFNLDITATSITVTIIAGTQNSVHSVEVFGNP